MINLFFILCLGWHSLDCLAQINFEAPFFFGLATAPGHAEDQLDDIWWDFAKDGKVAAFKNASHPQERLQFWTKPEIELDLAAQTGIQLYRLGIDWGRIMPTATSFDENAIKRYHEILKMVRDRKMKVMLTLMHHSIPKWAQAQGGWLSDEMKKHFLFFSQRMIKEFNPDVDYWITFNEGNIFATLAYTVGLWPPGEKRPLSSMLALGPFFRGTTIHAMDRMAEAHIDTYTWAHQQYPSVQMGIAHHLGFHTGKTPWDRWISHISGELMNWRFPEKIRNQMDFFGFNYYGAEWIKGSQVDVDPEEEYSEAGRAIYPEGLYLLLKKIHEKYPSLPIIITENGIADATDILRPSYLLEHLAAVGLARQEGVPVIGYIFWTLTDNMEWSDGYCPKFGLVSVDREKNLQRIPRQSYELYKKIVTQKMVSKEMRSNAWNNVLAHQGQERPFCRASDGISALDIPVKRKIVTKDWRFRP